MTFVTELPKIKVLVECLHLTRGEQLGYVEAYLVSAHCRYGRPIFFTVHTQTGAVWSMLHIGSIVCDRFSDLPKSLPVYSLQELQPYSCLEGPVQCIAPEYLRNYEMKVKIGKAQVKANYLFTIDYGGTGLAEDPEQYKSHNVCVLENGQLAALPNNYCLFIDEHFTGRDIEVPNYKRSSVYHLPGS